MAMLLSTIRSDALNLSTDLAQADVVSNDAARWPIGRLSAKLFQSLYG
jgi:hypothetical protein